MSGRISLALVLHNHQPVGNFGWVIDEVYRQAYEPMVGALERHPGIRVGLHYSGPLLEWLRAERPELIDRLRALVARDQVEILGGGLYEPILPSLPARDRIGQLERMAVAVEAAFGRRPAGAWLAERVWEPDLPGPLATAGYRYTILDDAHFRAAAIAEDAMWGPYLTEDQGRTLTVFGTEQGLRYRIPFQPVDDVIDYLRAHATEAGERVGMMGDDGEKFGAWPSTWEHCWGEGHWVEDFFGAVESNRDWLTPVRPGDWLADHAPVGRAYVPTSSYAEMGEWALPPAESLALSAALHRARHEGGPEARWLRGGFWRNFQVRYGEINDLHKQMLRTSAKVAAMARDPADRGDAHDPAREAAVEVATDQLYRGQSNDCYWHGLFGGIYISHMRAATFAALIAAEDAADAALGTLDAAEQADLDLDGRDELLLANAGEVVTVDLDEGGGIGSWDLRAARHAVGAVLRRRPEAYHERLRALDAPEASAAATAATVSTPDGGPDGESGPERPASSIHDGTKAKEAGLAGRLVYDDYERRSGLIRALDPGDGPAGWRAGGGPDLGDPAAPMTVRELGRGRVVLTGDSRIAGQAVRIEKELQLGGGRLDPSLALAVTVEHRGDAPISARLGLEWVSTMLGGGANPAAWWEIAGRRGSHDGAGQAEQVGGVAQGNDWLGITIDTIIEPAADAWWAPIETVSNSEAGVERAYQGSALLVSMAVELAPGQRWTLRLEHRVSTRQDRAEDGNSSEPKPASG